MHPCPTNLSTRLQVARSCNTPAIQLVNDTAASWWRQKRDAVMFQLQQDKQKHNLESVNVNKQYHNKLVLNVRKARQHTSHRHQTHVPLQYRLKSVPAKSPGRMLLRCAVHLRNNSGAPMVEHWKPHLILQTVLDKIQGGHSTASFAEEVPQIEKHFHVNLVADKQINRQ